MRTIVIVFVSAAVLTAGCLRSTAFRCTDNSDCGAGGVCERVGFCSVPNANCPGSGRSYGDSAGQGLSNTCVPPGPGVDAGIDASVDASIDVMPTRCPSGYAAVASSPHLYKALSDVTWDEAATMCKQTSQAAYLAIPDDATELANLATVASPPFGIGIDDKANQGEWMTQKSVLATFLPWAPGQPPSMGPQNECVDAISATQIATEKCGNRHAAVCECEP